MTTTATPDAPARSYPARMGTLDPATAIPDLRAALEHAATHTPRSLQTALGPSQIGTGCDRCLVHMLAGTPEVDTPTAWLPIVGTAVHEWCETAILAHLAATGDDRYIVEGRVAVGTVGGQLITGSTDVLDTWSGTVIDYKLVGSTTLRNLRASGPSLTYQRQAALYGFGWEQAGYTVRSVAIFFLARNGLTFSDHRAWQAPYDRDVALATLQRADQFATWIRDLGADTVLTATPPHTGHEFTCARYVDGAAPATHQLAGIHPAVA